MVKNRVLDDLDLDRMTVEDAVYEIRQLSQNVLPKMAPKYYEQRLDAINVLVRIVIARAMTGR